MAGSSQHDPSAARIKLEFPIWHRTFAKSYSAWANAPSDLKTALLLQGQALAKAEGWLLACPDKLTESQKRFIVRSIAQRARGPGETTLARATRSSVRNWKWRRSSDRSLWHLYAVIGLGLWFFSPDIIRDAMERALNSPEVYSRMNAPQVAGAPPADGSTPVDLASQSAPEPSADRVAAAPEGDIDETPAIYKPPSLPASLAVRLADLASDKLKLGQNRVALLLGIEAAEEALADKETGHKAAAVAASVLTRAMATREQIGQLAPRSATARTIVFCDNASALLAIAGDDSLSVWPAARTQRSASWPFSQSSLQGASVDRDCRRVLLPNEDFNIEVREISGGRLVSTLHGHEANIHSSSFNSSGTLIVSASQDATARIWDARTGRLRHLLSGHDWHVVGAEFSPDGRLVITASSDMTARIWDVATGRQVHALRGHQGVVTTAHFSADGNRAMTTSWDGFVRLWNVADGKAMLALQQPGGLMHAALSRDGTSIATASSDGRLQIWNAEQGELRHEMPGHQAGIREIRFTPDDNWLIVLSWDGIVEIYDTRRGKLFAALSGSDHRIRAIQVGQGGRTLVGLTESDIRLTWPLLFSPDEAVAEAKSIAPACLSTDERTILGLEGGLPGWCSTIRTRDAALP